MGINIRPAIPTMALGFGTAGHSMTDKLQAAASCGFEGVEIFYACLDSYAQTFVGRSNRDKLRAAAKSVGRQCKDLNLEVVCLQPLLNYEGILDPTEHMERLDECLFRFELCKLLGTDTIQVPASFRTDPGVTGDEYHIVQDFRELADKGLKESRPIKIAYENLGWSTYVNTWQRAVEIVKLVDRPNFGMCIDAYNIASFVYADPEVVGGVQPNGPEQLQRSLDELEKSLPVEKVWFAQVIDCEMLNIPLGTPASPYYVKGQNSRMSWSRNCRVFPFEYDRGAFLPIAEIAISFVKTGYRGWLSFELWNRFVTSDSDPRIPMENARRAWESWTKMQSILEENP